MGANTVGEVLLWLIGVAIAIVILVYILRWLYRRSTKETAFVRTGFLGEKVVVNSGAFVIPVLHEITPVNMNVMRIEVMRRDNSALITRNRMRVDIIAEFFVRVGASKAAVAAAAQTLGRRTLQEDGIRSLLEGKFASSMRMVAAQMTLEEMHEQRRDYANQVAGHGVRSARRQRARARECRHRRPRSDQPRIFRSVERLRRRGPHPAHGIDRDAAQDAQRDRAAHAGRYPQPEPGSAEESFRDRSRDRICAARTGARGRVPPRRAARRTDEGARAARAGGRRGPACLAPGGRDGAAGAAAHHHPGAHPQRRGNAAARNRPPPRARRSRAEDARADRARADQSRSATGDRPHRPRARAARTRDRPPEGARDLRTRPADRAVRKDAGGDQGGRGKAPHRDRRKSAHRGRAHRSGPGAGPDPARARTASGRPADRQAPGLRGGRDRRRPKRSSARASPPSAASKKRGSPRIATCARLRPSATSSWKSPR